MNLATKQSWIDKNLARLAKAKPEVAAPVLDRHVRWMEQKDKARFIEWGACCVMMEDRKLWKLLTDEQGNSFHSFESWLMHSAPNSRATAYDAMRSLRELQCVSMDDLRQVPRMNIRVLRLLPVNGKSDPEILSAAKTQSEKQFRKTARTRFPDSHIEAIEPMKLKPEASQRELIDFGIEAAQYIFHTSNREQSLESIIVSWLASPCETEGYTDMSNREFFESRTLPSREHNAVMAAHV